MVDRKELLAGESRDRIVEEVMKKEAIPELRFKLQIFETQENMINAEMEMNYNKGFHKRTLALPQDKQNFKSTIIALFSYLKYMIVSYMSDVGEKQYKHDKEIFTDIEKLEYGIEVSERKLTEYKNFLLLYMHYLKLTDLLRKPIDWEEEFKKSY